MTEHAFNVICNTGAKPVDMNYLTVKTNGISVKRFNLPEKYVVMTTAYTAKVRQFLPKHINSVSQYIKSKGYEVVFLGKKETKTGACLDTINGEFDADIDFNIGIDLNDKTTLLESLLIIKGAKTIVGLDNGLLHLAGTTDIPIVGGFTTVNPEHRMPYRDGIMGKNYYPVVLDNTELACSHCQSNFNFTFRFDFRKCYHDDFKCLEMLNADKYIAELDKILD